MSDLAVYMVTHNEIDCAIDTIKLLRRVSGCDFDIFVADSGSPAEEQAKLLALEKSGEIAWLFLSNENIGQNLASNVLLDQIAANDNYRWVVCWSADVKPRGRRALKKLRKAAQAFFNAGVSVLLAPKVSGAEVPEPFTATGDDIGFPYHEVDFLRGFVRVHPAAFFREFRFNKFGSLASGEGREVKDAALKMKMPCVVVDNVKVKHVGAEPDIFARYVGYGL